MLAAVDVAVVLQNPAGRGSQGSGLTSCETLPTALTGQPTQQKAEA